MKICSLRNGVPKHLEKTCEADLFFIEENDHTENLVAFSKFTRGMEDILPPGASLEDACFRLLYEFNDLILINGKVVADIEFPEVEDALMAFYLMKFGTHVTLECLAVDKPERAKEFKAVGNLLELIPGFLEAAAEILEREKAEKNHRDTYIITCMIFVKYLRWFLENKHTKTKGDPTRTLH